MEALLGKNQQGKASTSKPKVSSVAHKNTLKHDLNAYRGFKREQIDPAIPGQRSDNALKNHYSLVNRELSRDNNSRSKSKNRAARGGAK